MKQQAGVSLIEVLIAVLVLAIGLLGIAGLQTAALTNNLTSYQYSQAAILAQSMAERMRGNRQAVLGNSYSLTPGATAAASQNCTSGSCTPAQQALWDAAVFYAQVTGATVANVPTLTSQNTSGAVAGLPSGAASISCTNPYTNNGSCVITVYWDPGRNATATNYSCSTSDSTALRCFVLAVQP
jgi:type IV pilus assembly protein PilV